MPKRISERMFRDIENMLSVGDRSYVEIADVAGVAQSLVCSIANGEHFYQRDSAAQERRLKRRSQGRPSYLPTPEQIELECS